VRTAYSKSVAVVAETIVVVLVAFGSAYGEDLCDVARQPTRWKDKDVSVMVRLVLNYHDATLIPITEPLNYRGKCVVYPIFPGTPAFLTRGLTHPGGAPGQLISRTLEAYKRAEDPEQWCFSVTGTLKIAENYRYASGKGNGYGYTGYYPFALLLQAFRRVSCGVQE